MACDYRSMKIRARPYTQKGREKEKKEAAFEALGYK